MSSNYSSSLRSASVSSQTRSSSVARVQDAPSLPKTSKTKVFTSTVLPSSSSSTSSSTSSLLNSPTLISTQNTVDSNNNILSNFSVNKNTKTSRSPSPSTPPPLSTYSQTTPMASMVDNNNNNAGVVYNNNNDSSVSVNNSNINTNNNNNDSSDLKNMLALMMQQLHTSNQQIQKQSLVIEHLLRRQNDRDAENVVKVESVLPSSVPSSSNISTSTPSSNHPSTSFSSIIKKENNNNVHPSLLTHSPSSDSDQSSPDNSPIRYRSRSRQSKSINSSVKMSKEEKKVIKKERQLEKDEEEIYENVSDDDPYLSYNAFLVLREKYYPYNKNIKLYEDNYSLLCESGRFCEYIRFMLVCDADKRLYSSATKRWCDFKFATYTGTLTNKQRVVSDNVIIVPQLSYDDRDIRFNVINSETNDLPASPYALLGVPTSLYKGISKTIKYTTATEIFNII